MREEGKCLRPPEVGLRGEQWKDWSYRRWNSVIMCYHKLGLSKVKIERTMYLNLRFGSWHGHSHWHTLREAFLEYHRSSSSECPLFQLVMERIVRQRYGGDLPGDYGTVEFSKQLWESLPSSQYWGGIKNEVKLNRFFSFCGRSRELRPDDGVLLLTLLYIGITKGWFHGVDDTPLCAMPKTIDFDAIPSSATAPPASSSAASASTTAASSGASSSSSGPSRQASGLANARGGHPKPSASAKAISSAAASAPPAKTTMQAANQDVKKAARKVECTMYTCLLALANSTTERLAAMMDEVPRPLEEVHSKEMTIHKTQAGLLRWHTMMANGEFTAPLIELASLPRSARCCRLLGFRDSNELMEPDSAELVEEEIMSSTMVDLVRMLISTELQSLRTFHDRLPGRFAAPLHDDESARKHASDFCAQLYDSIAFFEKVALEDDWVADYVSKLIWPANTWVRETLFALDECRFHARPGRHPPQPRA